MAEERGRQRRHRGAGVGHEDLGHGQVEQPLDEQGHRTGLDRRRRVVMAVRPATGDAAEERTRGHRPRIVDDVEDLDVVVAGPSQVGPVELAREGAQEHGCHRVWRVGAVVVVTPAGGTVIATGVAAGEPASRALTRPSSDTVATPTGVPPSSCTGAPPAARSVAAGGMPSRRRAKEAILAKAGAAVVPPVYLPALGSSIITYTDSAGCSAGTTPMKVDWYWVMPLASVYLPPACTLRAVPVLPNVW